MSSTFCMLPHKANSSTVWQDSKWHKFLNFIRLSLFWRHSLQNLVGLHIFSGLEFEFWSKEWVSSGSLRGAYENSALLSFPPQMNVEFLVAIPTFTLKLISFGIMLKKTFWGHFWKFKFRLNINTISPNFYSCINIFLSPRNHFLSSLSSLFKIKLIFSHEYHNNFIAFCEERVSEKFQELDRSLSLPCLLRAAYLWPATSAVRHAPTAANHRVRPPSVHLWFCSFSKRSSPFSFDLCELCISIFARGLFLQFGNSSFSSLIIVVVFLIWIILGVLMRIMLILIENYNRTSAGNLIMFCLCENRCKWIDIDY